MSFDWWHPECTATCYIINHWLILGVCVCL